MILNRIHHNKMWNHNQTIKVGDFRSNILNCLGLIDIDERIKPVVIALNKAGYITTDCCAGHIDADIQLGYISFLDRLNTRRVNSVFQKLGFQKAKACYGAINYGCSVCFLPYSPLLGLENLIDTLIYPDSIRIVQKTDDNIILHFNRKNHAWLHN